MILFRGIRIYQHTCQGSNGNCNICKAPMVAGEFVRTFTCLSGHDVGDTYLIIEVIGPKMIVHKSVTILIQTLLSPLEVQKVLEEILFGSLGLT